MDNSPADAALLERSWYVVGRCQEYEGEARSNLLRVVAVGGFYAVQLLSFGLLANSPTPADISFQRSITWICAGWLFVALAILIAQQRRFFPPMLKYISVSADLLLLTAACSLGSGPTSPLVFVYFLIVSMAALRFSLTLVRATTLGAMACYIFLLGQADANWFDSSHTTPVVNQLVILLSLGLCGIILGQMIRRVRWMANRFATNLTR